MQKFLGTGWLSPAHQSARFATAASALAAQAPSRPAIRRRAADRGALSLKGPLHRSGLFGRAFEPATASLSCAFSRLPARVD